MTEIRIVPIDPARLATMRAAGADEHGNPWTRRTAEGWEPLRCCLRRAAAGADIALISYSPWTAPSPWAESGPVFVHHGPCAGYGTPAEYPDDMRGDPRLLRPYRHDGAIAYAAIRPVRADEDPTAALAAVLDDPDVSHVHVRSATAGCLTFEVRRA